MTGVQTCALPISATTLGRELAQRIDIRASSPTAEDEAQETAARRLTARHRGGMVDAVAREVVRLVADGDADPGDIAIIAPHADGVLRFLIGEALRSAQIPCAIIRRFESLREEPEVRVALALGYAVHPEEGEDAETPLEHASKPRIRMV